MLTKAGVIVIPKYIEKLVKAQLAINNHAPNEFFVKPQPYRDCAASVDRAIGILSKFCTDHHHDFEVVQNQFDDRTDRKNLRKKYATVRIYGTVADKFEEILRNQE